MTIAIVGEFNEANGTHVATDDALARLGEEARWVPTTAVLADPDVLEDFAGLLISPGSPYASMEGALAAIEHARLRRLPLLGTCGGFQHVVVEYARNVLGIEAAEHAETAGDADDLVILPLACSLLGQEHEVRIEAGSLARQLYGRPSTIEPYFCGYGLNGAYRGALEHAGLRFVGFDDQGEPRILELAEHPFFLATLYVPQASRSEPRHPLLVGFVEACRAVAHAR